MGVSTVAERLAGRAPSAAAGRPGRSRLTRLLVLAAAVLGLWVLLAAAADRARADQGDGLTTALEQYGNQLSPAAVQALLDHLPPASSGGSAQNGGSPGPPLDPPVDPPPRGSSDESGTLPVVDPPPVTGQPPTGPPVVEKPPGEPPVVDPPAVGPPEVVETPPAEPPPVDPAPVVEAPPVDPAPVVEAPPVVETPPVIEAPPVVDPAPVVEVAVVEVTVVEVAAVVEVAEIAAVPPVPEPAAATVPEALADCDLDPLPGPASMASRATTTQHPADDAGTASAAPEATTSPSQGSTPLPPAPPLAPTSLPVPPAPSVPGGTTATASAGPSTCGAGHSDRQDLLTAVLAAGLPASLARATFGYAGGPDGSVVRGVGDPGDRPD